MLTPRGTLFTGVRASKARKAWTRLQPLLDPLNALPASILKMPASAASAPGSFRTNDPVLSDFGTAIAAPIVGLISARVCDTLRETLVGFELVEGQPEYSVKCLDVAVWSARSFAQSKIANEVQKHASPSAADVNGLTLKQVGAINLYSQEGPFYRRLNALLNAKKNRSQRLYVRVSVCTHPQHEAHTHAFSKNTRRRECCNKPTINLSCSHCTRLLTPFLLTQSLFPYIKLLLESIAKLPKYTGGWLYRGVSRDLCEDVTKYKEGQQFRWWGYTSCSIEADVAKRFSKPVCV